MAGWMILELRQVRKVMNPDCKKERGPTRTLPGPTRTKPEQTTGGPMGDSRRESRSNNELFLK
jgi:hypothetical protein